MLHALVLRGVGIAVAVVAMTGGAAAQPFAPGTQERALAQGGVPRPYVVHVPSQAGPLPLVVMLHGAGGTARAAIERYGWDSAADREGFVVAAPQALPARPERAAGTADSPASWPAFWNDGAPGGPARGPDDVAFIAAVIADLTSDARIDRRRVFLAGFSDGGAMALRAGAALADRVLAVASVAGHWWTPQPRIAPPVSLILIVGDSDPLNPWLGGSGRDLRGQAVERPAFHATANAWSQAIDCGAGSASRDYPPSLINWRPCPGGAAIFMRTAHGMGHVWPGAARELPEALVGATVERRFRDATVEIWTFFRERPVR